MDSLDRTIIDALSRDARMPYSRIAEQAGVATTTVHQRAKRLVERGIIRGTKVSVDWNAIDLPIAALVSLTAPSDRPLKVVAEALGTNPHVISSYATTGEFDILLHVRARSSDQLGEILDELRHHAPGPTRTIVLLATYFEHRLPALHES